MQETNLQRRINLDKKINIIFYSCNLDFDLSKESRSLIP